MDRGGADGVALGIVAYEWSALKAEAGDETERFRDP